MRAEDLDAAIARRRLENQRALRAFCDLPKRIRDGMGPILGPRWNGSDVCDFMPKSLARWPRRVAAAWRRDSAQSPLLVPRDAAVVMRSLAERTGARSWRLDERRGRCVASVATADRITEASGHSALEAAFALARRLA